MYLDELPDLALIHILSKCEAKDILSLKRTNSNLYNHINYHRAYYKKSWVYKLTIKKTEDERYKICVDISLSHGGVLKTIPAESLKKTIEPLYPLWLVTDDNDDIANVSRLWWEDRTTVVLNNHVNYQKYLPYFDYCTTIILECTSPINLSEIVQSMEMKNLQWLSLKGDIECTDEDIRKLGRISCRLACIELNNVSESSNITNDAILDMIEIGYVPYTIRIYISRIQDFESIEASVQKRSWVANCNKLEPNKIELEITNAHRGLYNGTCYIMTKNETLSD